MYGSHESSQYVEVVSGDGYNETEFLFALTCVARAVLGSLSSPPEDCYEQEDPEFELDSVHVRGTDGNPTSMSYQLLEAFVGKETAQKLMEDAVTEAIESGDF